MCLGVIYDACICFICLYMCVGVHVCCVAHMAIRGQLQTLVLAFCLLVGCCGSRDICPSSASRLSVGVRGLQMHTRAPGFCWVLDTDLIHVFMFA